MSERYNRLFSLPEDLYAANSPVVIAAGVLLKDTATGKVLAQLKLRNITGKIIRAVIVHIYAADVTGNTVCSTEYQYLDLHATRDTFFGQKSAIILSDNTARSFAVQVKSVIFSDGSTWSEDCEQWDSLPTPQTLFTVLMDRELEVQYRLIHGNSALVYPMEYKDLWFCTCGALNHAHESNCNKCRRAFSKLMSTTKEELVTARDARLEEQRRKEEDAKQRRIELAKREEERKAALRAKIKKTVKIVTPIAAVLILIALGLFYYFSYQDSVKKVEMGSFHEAREQLIFASITNLHDENYLPYLTAGEYLESNNYTAAREYLKPLAEKNYRKADELLLEADYLEGSSLLKANRFEDSYAVFETLAGLDYKDSAQMMIECRLQQGKYHENNEDYRSAMSAYQKLLDVGYQDAQQLFYNASFLYAVDCLENKATPGAAEVGLSTLNQLTEKGYEPARQKRAFYRTQIYDKAVALLEAGAENNNRSKIGEARQYFAALDDFKRTKDYLLLIDGYFNSHNVTLEELWELRDLEVAMYVILSQDMLQEFLEGTWYTKDYAYYFTMDAEGSISYSLPWIDYGDYYKIENGIFMLYPERNEQSTRNLFKFTIVDWNTVKVYCYKGGKTYTLYRR